MKTDITNLKVTPEQLMIFIQGNSCLDRSDAKELAEDICVNFASQFPSQVREPMSYEAFEDLAIQFGLKSMGENGYIDKETKKALKAFYDNHINVSLPTSVEEQATKEEAFKKWYNNLPKHEVYDGMTSKIIGNCIGISKEVARDIFMAGYSSQVSNPVIADKELSKNKEKLEDLVKSILGEPLSKDKENAVKAFIEVCNEPIPDGMGKEYMNAMIKMKAFMAGRCFEFSPQVEVEKENAKELDDIWLEAFNETLKLLKPDTTLKRNGEYGVFVGLLFSNLKKRGVFSKDRVMDNWISVEKELPENTTTLCGDEVLVCRDLGDRKIIQVSTIYDLHKYGKMNNVTHWQPLPKAPTN